MGKQVILTLQAIFQIGDWPYDGKQHQSISTSRILTRHTFTSHVHWLYCTFIVLTCSIWVHNRLTIAAIVVLRIGWSWDIDIHRGEVCERRRERKRDKVKTDKEKAGKLCHGEMWLPRLHITVLCWWNARKSIYQKADHAETILGLRLNMLLCVKNVWISKGTATLNFMDLRSDKSLSQTIFHSSPQISCVRKIPNWWGQSTKQLQRLSN